LKRRYQLGKCGVDGRLPTQVDTAIDPEEPHARPAAPSSELQHRRDIVTWTQAPIARADATIGHLDQPGQEAGSRMKKLHTAFVIATMGALTVLLAPHASADFDRPGYLRCMASDAMAVGGVPIPSSTLAKIGADAYSGGSGDTAATALAKKYKLSDSLAALIVQCAHPQT
jgi:hypothetical protein